MQTLLRFFFFFAKDFSMSPLDVTRHCGSVHLGVVVLRVGYFEHALLQLNNCHHILPEKINPLLYLFAEPHITQYVPIHNKNPVISWQCLKICTSSMPTCLEPNCNIRHKWVQPGEWGLSQLHWYWHFEEDWLTDVFSHPSHCTGYSSFLCRVIYVESYL